MKLNILIIALQITTVISIMDVNLTLIHSNNHINLTGHGLWLFCTADQVLRDVDWYKDNVRLDILPNGKTSSSFTCPEDMNSADEICEITYSHGHQLYVPEKYLNYNESWKCLAEPVEGYPVATDSKEYKHPVCDSSELDLVLILDESASVKDDNYQKLLKFIENFLSHIPIDNGKWRVGLMEYSINVRVLFYLNNYTTLNDILNAIKKIKYEGGFGTHTADALHTMHTVLFNTSNGDRPSAPNTAVLFTDGLSNDKRQTIQEATNAKNKGITVYTFCIALNDKSEIKQVSSDPYSKYGYSFASFDHIGNSSIRLFQSMLSDFVCQESIPTLTRSETQNEMTTAMASTTTMASTTKKASTTNAETVTSSEATTTATMETTLKMPTKTTETCKCINETEISKEDLDRRIEERRKRLRYDKESSPLERRKRSSAKDDRFLATVIGYTSIALLSLVFLIVMTIDCIDICRNRRKAIK